MIHRNLSVRLLTQVAMGRPNSRYELSSFNCLLVYLLKTVSTNAFYASCGGRWSPSRPQSFDKMSPSQFSKKLFTQASICLTAIESEGLFLFDAFKSKFKFFSCKKIITFACDQFQYFRVCAIDLSPPSKDIPAQLTI